MANDGVKWRCLSAWLNWSVHPIENMVFRPAVEIHAAQIPKGYFVQYFTCRHDPREMPVFAFQNLHAMELTTRIRLPVVSLFLANSLKYCFRQRLDHGIFHSRTSACRVNELPPPFTARPSDMVNRTQHEVRSGGNGTPTAASSLTCC